MGKYSYTSLSADDFALFAKDIFVSLDCKIILPRGRCSDGGKDLIVEEQGTGVSGNSVIRWLVSCKNDSIGNSSVEVHDERNILERTTANECDGFLCFYATIAGSSLIDHLENITSNSKQNFVYKIYDHREIEKLLGRLDVEKIQNMIERYDIVNQTNSHTENHFSNVNDRVIDNLKEQRLLENPSTEDFVNKIEESSSGLQDVEGEKKPCSGSNTKECSNNNTPLKGLSLFANVGIAEAYLANQNIEIVLANEIVEKRAQFYSHLYPKTKMISGDIQHEDVKKEIIETAREYNVEFVIATPPCQGMSSAGKQRKLDPRNNLVKDAIHIVKEIQPAYIILENVPEQKSTMIVHNGETLSIPNFIEKELRSEYYINHMEIDCSHYGVPQRRLRYIFLLTHKKMSQVWDFPNSSMEQGKTLRELLKDVPPLDPLLREGLEETLTLFPDYQTKLEVAQRISKWHRPVAHPKRQVLSLLRTPSGRSAFENEPEFRPKKKDGSFVTGYPNTYKRQEWDRPAYTITKYNRTISSQENVHPGTQMENTWYDSPRVFSVYELILMTSLPADWNIPDWATEPFVREILGEGFPPRAVELLCSRIPQKEVRHKENKRLRGLSLFANIGVAEAHLDSIDCEVVLANEIEASRSRLYSKIYPDVEMLTGDICKDDVRDQLVEKSIAYGIDFVMATPPCQGMSLAGNLDPNDPRNTLVYYAIDVIKRVKPKFVLLENIPQQLNTIVLIDGVQQKIPQYIYHELSTMYRFNCDVTGQDSLIKASHYGVPQMRTRSIFLLVRNDLDFVWNFPKADKEEITLEKAIGHVPPIDPMIRGNISKTREMFPHFEERKKLGEALSPWHRPPVHKYEHVLWMQHTPSGKTAFDNDTFFPQKQDGTPIKGHYNHYRRLAWNKPSRSLTTNNGVISSLACGHPGRCIVDDGTETGRIYSDPRVMTLYEIFIISSLPIDWPVPITTSESLLRTCIGEGIPPLLVQKLFRRLLELYVSVSPVS